jgi:hypothetical protein
MKEITRLYALEWYGPYDSIEEMWEDYDTEQCSIYLITGKEKYERGAEHIKYVGITERDPCKRLTDHDHQEKQAKIQYKKYWVGRFSRSSNKNSRAHAELIESLYIRYLYLQEIRIINDKKLKRAPRYPLAVLNRWFRRTSEGHRVNKPARLSDLPDVMLFDGCEYWGSNKLKHFISEE